MFPNRIERVAETIQEILATIIHDEMKDPGIPEIFTITRVEVTRDLRIARIHFSQIPDDPESVDASKAALERAKGFLRHELGNRMPLKYLPALEFFFDRSPAHAQRIEQLLHGLNLHSGPAAPTETEEEKP